KMADIPEETTEKIVMTVKKEIDSDDVSSKLQEMKNLQKLRKRQHGVSIVSLALGKKVTQDDEVLVSDPFKLKNWRNGAYESIEKWQDKARG
ncbi:hypothetical protein L9F63_027691, partial [Diploptera punctata]